MYFNARLCSGFAHTKSFCLELHCSKLIWAHVAALMFYPVKCQLVSSLQKATIQKVMSWWLPTLVLYSLCEESHLVISPKRVWGQYRPRETAGRRGRWGWTERGQFCYTESKSQHLFLSACVVLCVWRGGSWPFELFRTCDNGWMLRTYVERPLWLMAEELHADPAVWQNTRALLSLRSPQLMNAWMAEWRYWPLRGQSPQEFTFAQMRPAMANTFA